MLAKKQNVFDDFRAAGDWLAANNITTRSQLAIMGADVSAFAGIFGTTT